MLFNRCFVTVTWKLIVINMVLTTSSRIIQRRTTRGSSTPAYEKEPLDCGVPVVTPNIFNRIIGGTEVRRHSYPWQVSLLRKGPTWQHFCGGSIVASGWIITAAHCVFSYDAADFRVLVGGHDRNSTENVSLMELDRIIVHEDYKGRSTQWKNDVALILLTDPIEFNTFAQPICLSSDKVEDGSPLVATGWGKTGGGESSPVLNQVVVPLYSWTKCKKVYPSVLSENMICAGYEEGGRDSCQGDSGGPLVRYSTSSGNWFLQGITSVGSACAAPRKPGIYTSVPDYFDWVQTQINDVDECKNKRTNKCEQLCLNSIGSYTCSCADGYSLHANGFQCTNGPAPRAFFESTDNRNIPGEKKTPTTLNHGECGLSVVAFRQRRRHPMFEDSPSSAPALPHSYPSIVSISYKWENWRHRCCGSIVGPRWILTTASCLHNYRNVVLPADQVRILAGAHSLDFLEETEQEILGEKAFIHAGFDSETMNNNIALLYLQKPIVYNNRTRSVCLPFDQATVDYRSCRSIGWTTNSTDAKKTILVERFLQTAGKNCNLGGRNVTDGVCAKLANVGQMATSNASNADPGGPMLCLAGDRVTILGLTIYRVFQPKSNNPFINVVNHCDWISHTMTKV